MSLSEQQIRAIVKEELRKILDAGLMYTTECTPQNGKPTIETPPQPPTNHPLSGLPKEQSDKLEAERKGNIWVIKNIDYLPQPVWEQINKYMREQGGKWVPSTNNEHGYWAIPVKP